MIDNLRGCLPEMNIMGVQTGGDRTSYLRIPKPMEIDFKPNMFSPIDCVPQVKSIDLGEIDLHKFGIFRKLNEEANLYLPEKTIDELMKEILKKQEPKQKEIRQNNRRREFMDGFNGVDQNPLAEIKCQLIAI